MVLIKLTINDKGPFSFILDTGVGFMVITEPSLIDTLKIASKRSVIISGLGTGANTQALLTEILKVDIPGLRSHGVAAAIFKEDYFNLSNYAGQPVHGLLGQEFFRNLTVQINFSDSTITVCQPKHPSKLRKGTKIPLSIEGGKPYIQGKVLLPGSKKIDNKLLIDLGAGHAASLEHLIQKQGMPERFVSANLGTGLNGPISGYISRASEIELRGIRVKMPLVAFPDTGNTNLNPSVPRDGSIGMDILKRFRIVFDYSDSTMYLKPSRGFKDPFEHDMSGIEYIASGENLKHILITRVEPGSAAFEIGLERGDEIVSINLKPVAHMSIEEIDNLFKSRDQRSFLLDIFHDNKHEKVIITLKRRI